MKKLCKQETCPYHNQALFNVASVETKHGEKLDELEAYCNQLHDLNSILTKRVEQLERIN